MDIDLAIERIVIEGLPLDPAQRALLLQSLTAELERLLDRGRGWSPAASATVQAPDVPFDDGAHGDTDAQMTRADLPAGLGRGLARSIYEGMRP